LRDFINTSDVFPKQPNYAVLAGFDDRLMTPFGSTGMPVS
jgi:hypothetical protein